ncbi:hypothetical protein EXIGLDRAFT_733544 [Exidia glandulosa HHB12029]|uniref:Uncharacterized protein n=1 Tax=Exidia glandulosa HHB12029 TaxID=1314781 RepID=A0A165BA00_EXIGL|nr:hypothetical protein EXIGLDRAFT_733544 [Exidia glandulosa HHB12029]
MPRILRVRALVLNAGCCMCQRLHRVCSSSARFLVGDPYVAALLVLVRRSYTLLVVDLSAANIVEGGAQLGSPHVVS